jgi:hypothetical protein
VGAARQPLPRPRHREAPATLETFVGTEKQANQALGKLIASTSAERSPATDATFGHLLATWLERCERNLAESTVVGYRRIVDDLWMPKLGHVPLSQLESRTCRRCSTGTTAAR